MIKKCSIVFICFLLPCIILTCTEVLLIKKEAEESKLFPFPFSFHSIAIDENGTLYLGSTRNKKAFAFDKDTLRLKYSVKIETFSGGLTLVGAGKNEVWVFPYRADKIEIYQDGNLIKERSPTEKEERISNRKKAVDSEGNTYTLKNKFGYQYIKKTSDSTGKATTILHFPRKQTIITMIFTILEIVFLALSFLFFVLFIFQSVMKNRFGEDRFYTMKDFFRSF